MGTNVQDVAARAKQLISERKYQEAVRACRRVLLSKPDEVPVRLLLAQALLALNRHDEVRIEMQTLTRKAPDVAAAHRLLAEAYIRSGQKDAAEAALKRALQLDASDEDASDLMEELDEVEAPPKAETIDRWFTNEPATLETRLESEELPPATAPAEMHSPTIQLDPEFEKEASAPSKKVRKRTMLGMPAIAAPSAAVTKKPSRPRDSAPPPKLPAAALDPPVDPGPAPHPMTSELTAPRGKRPERSAKRTMMGLPAALPTPSPTSLEPEDSIDTGTSELDSGALELVAEDVLKKDTTTELTADDLGGASLLDGNTETLSTQELSLIEAGSTEELSAGDIALSEVDPYADLGEGLPPLDGENTEARSPASDYKSPSDPPGEFEDEKTRGRPAPAAAPPVARGPFETVDPFDDHFDGEIEGEATQARPPAIAEDSFDDMPTMARDRADFPVESTSSARPSRMKPEPDSVEDLLTTTARPIVAEFPDDAVDTGLPPLPPLSGEATVARDEPAAPIGRPTAGAAGQMPSGFAPSPAPPMSGEARIPPPDPAVPPKMAPKRRRTLRQTLNAGPLARIGELPLYGQVAVAGVPVLVLALIIVGVRSWSASRSETAIQAAVDRASQDGLMASAQTANELDADEDVDSPAAVARRARLYAMVALEHGYESDELQTQARSSALALVGELEGTEYAQSPDRIAAQIYLALEAGDSERANILADQVPESATGELAYAAGLTYFAQGELERAEQLLVRCESMRAPRYNGLLARVRAERGEIDSALALLEPFPEASPVRGLAFAEVSRFQSPAAFLDAANKLTDSAILTRASPHQKSWALLLNAEARAANGQQDAVEVAASAEATRPRGDERFILRLAELYRQAGANARAATALMMLPETPARPEVRAGVQAEVHLAARNLAEVARVLDAAGESPQTAYLRGRLAEEQDERDAAIAFYTTASQDPGQFVRSKTRLGAIALAAGDEDEAIAHLEAANANEGTNVDVVSLLVEAYLADSDMDKAVQTLQGARTRGFDSPELIIAGAKVDLARGEAASALTALTTLEGQRSQDPAFLGTLGEAARQSGDAARASAAFERALTLDRQNRNALIGMVEIALAATDIEGANGALAQARENGIGGRTIRLLEGRTLVLRGAGDEAADMLRPLIGRGRRRSSDPMVWTAYGVALGQAESDRLAVRALDRAIRLDENQIEAHLALAAVRTRGGDLAAATSATSAAELLVERQSLGPIYEARVLAARGRILYENNRMDQARARAEEAIAKDARSSEAHLLMGLVEDAGGRRAAPHLRRALEGRYPIPEILGQLVVLDARNPDRCDFAARYLRAAPRGIDAGAATGVSRRCR